VQTTSVQQQKEEIEDTSDSAYIQRHYGHAADERKRFVICYLCNFVKLLVQILRLCR
jgi:hypothetical protein